MKDGYFQPIDEDTRLSFGQALLKANFGSQNARFDSVAGLRDALWQSNVVRGYLMTFGSGSVLVGNPAKLAGQVALEKSLSGKVTGILKPSATIGVIVPAIVDNDSRETAAKYRNLQIASERQMTNADLGLGLGMDSTDSTSTSTRAKPIPSDQSADPYAVDPSGSW